MNHGESAGAILRRRYVRGDAARNAAVERERVNAEIAGEIYELRVAAGLTQQQLASRVGTQQSVISRLEDAEYEGHSLSMLRRVAGALGQRLEVRMVPDDPAA
jgi:ribosome-binding protein aMBF1 (putative translation factor)